MTLPLEYRASASQPRLVAVLSRVVDLILSITLILIAAFTIVGAGHGAIFGYQLFTAAWGMREWIPLQLALASGAIGLIGSALVPKTLLTATGFGAFGFFVAAWCWFVSLNERFSPLAPDVILFSLITLAKLSFLFLMYAIRRTAVSRVALSS